MGLSFSSFSKERRLEDLTRSVQYCRLCHRLAHQAKILSAFNGNVHSKVLFIAEAPGRLGAAKTGVPLFGDKSGENFEKLLGNIGWRREDVFITNAVLCNPRDESGNNGTPTEEEIWNCSVYLEMTIELVDPDVVVTLGRVALTALGFIRPHSYDLRSQVGKPLPWDRRILIPLYHPGPRALVHRCLAKQRSDFMALAKVVHPVRGLIRRARTGHANTKVDIAETRVTALECLILMIVEVLGTVSLFKLTKLLYLADLAALDRLGRTITGQIYLRQREGPWPPALKDAIEALKGREITTGYSGGKPVVGPGPSRRFQAKLDESEIAVLEEIIQKYGGLTDARLKSAVYRTPPMRYLLEQESLGRDVRRIPVIYREKVSWELDNVK